MFVECSKFVMLPHLLTNARPFGGSMMWIDIGVTLLLALRTTLFKASLPRMLEPGYEASAAARGNEENVVRQGEVDNSSSCDKVLDLQKTKTAAITYLCNGSSDRPRGLRHAIPI
jgi:hypothetical protein